MKITRFTGINNQLPEERLTHDPKTGTIALVEATNVDIGLAGEVRRRDGFSEAVDASQHSYLWEAEGFTLAVRDGDLVRLVDGNYTTLAADVAGPVRYATWPDGRVAASDGTSAWLVGLETFTQHGVPTPLSAGNATGESGGFLPAGTYSWQVSYVRGDRVEGAPLLSSVTIDLTDNQKFTLADLPALTGFTIKVSLTHHNGGVLRLAGETADDTVDTFTYDGKLEGLVRESQTEHTDPAPGSSYLGFWRGRALAAVGKFLFASRHADPEHFKFDQDFKAFGANITMVQPVDGGIFVGTASELAFLGGSTWDALTYSRRIAAGVVPGSGVLVPGDSLKRGEGVAGPGDCFMAICGGHIVAGYQDGACAILTEDVYRTDAISAEATFRVTDDGIAQYLASVD